MARHKRTLIEEEPETQLDISSLIDICFLVLIYFLVAMTIVPAEQDLAMALPGYEGEAQPPIPPMVLRIDGQGGVFSGSGASARALDSDPGSRELRLLASELSLYASAARAAGDTPSVLLRVDENAVQQRVIDVLNALAVEKISSVAFEDLVPL